VSAFERTLRLQHLVSYRSDARVKVTCTRHRVVAAWASTALILAAVSSHFFATVDYPYRPPHSAPAHDYDDPQQRQQLSDAAAPNSTWLTDVDESSICYVRLAGISRVNCINGVKDRVTVSTRSVPTRFEARDITPH